MNPKTFGTYGGKDRKLTSLRISPDLKNRLTVYAQHKGITLNAYMVLLLENGLNRDLIAEKQARQAQAEAAGE